MFVLDLKREVHKVISLPRQVGFCDFWMILLLVVFFSPNFCLLQFSKTITVHLNIHTVYSVYYGPIH